MVFDIFFFLKYIFVKTVFILGRNPIGGRAWQCSGGEDRDGCALVVRVAWGYKMAWSAELFGRRQRCGSSPASGGAQQQGGHWDDVAVTTDSV